MNEGIPIKRIPTEKEIELVQMLANDLSAKDISKKRGLTEKTIHAEISKTLKAYGCTGRMSLLVLFFRNGLVK